MANQPEQIQWDEGVYQLETTDPVQGGVGGTSNRPILNLANRTAYLKDRQDKLVSGETIPPTVAPKNSPEFTGTPTAPDVTLGDRSGKIANTKFVQDTVHGLSSLNVSGNTNVTLGAQKAGAGVQVFTGVLTGNIAVIVPAEQKSWIVSNRTSGAFSLTIKTAAGNGVVVAQGKNAELWCDGTNVLQSTNDYTNAALTGTPTAPTAATGNSSQQVANTEFVQQTANEMAIVYAIILGG
ncbi:hypothetical protein [Geminicoccus harenae]|uniref:hypothetical protein n=1 Tax=Geminicoccus harenae TaxID=2498453 RepID=UPI00168AE961|nr:hypothetical protein [Geminicoccus harenae]